jgi:thermostable 8-oxoguanine DNA glycosylase
MIDPRIITDYKRNDKELEEFLLFCVCVAGKTAKQICNALQLFLDNGKKITSKNSPFEIIKGLIEKNKLRDEIVESRLGQHNKLTRAFTEIVQKNFNLRKCAIEDLEEIYGIGPKTSRFFILHSRENQKIAVIDTHILKYVSRFLPNIPKTTPSKNKYKEIEKWFVRHCEDLRVSIADYDLKIWNSYSKG